MATLSPEQIILGFNEVDHRIRENLKAALLSTWRNAGSWREADMPGILNRVLPLVQGAQLSMANLTAAYVQALAVADGRRVSIEPVDRPEILGARGVDADVVYQRPAAAMYAALASGATVTDSIERGAGRLVALALTDLQLAKTHQERRSYRGAGYEFTIRTLTGRENCALCIIASTQRYHTSKLRPIHPGCDCGSRQVRTDYRPRQVINQERLDAIHDAVAQQFGGSESMAQRIDGLKTVNYAHGVRGADYTDLIVVQQHGEIGPLLAWRHQHFTGSDDL